MDIDLNLAEGSDMPEVDDSHVFDDSVPPKDRLLCLLDKVEAAVERFRKEALKMEEERDTLFTTLDTVRNSNLMNSLAESKYCTTLYCRYALMFSCIICYYSNVFARR